MLIHNSDMREFKVSLDGPVGGKVSIVGNYSSLLANSRCNRIKLFGYLYYDEVLSC